MDPSRIILIGHTLACTAVNLRLCFPRKRLIRGLPAIVFRAFFYCTNFDDGLVVASVPDDGFVEN